MSASMAEVLAEHRFLYGQRYGVERVERCSCGWQTNSGTRAWEAIAAHQAEVLAANGYGKLEDAQVIHVHHHDIEHHARSYNEGYEAAVTQGLADDPSLADDWYQDKIREARSAALEDAAEEWLVRSETFLKTMQNMSDSREYRLEDIVRYGAFGAEANSTAIRLRARAATERGEG